MAQLSSINMVSGLSLAFTHRTQPMSNGRQSTTEQPRALKYAGPFVFVPADDETSTDETDLGDVDGTLPGRASTNVDGPTSPAGPQRAASRPTIEDRWRNC